MHATSVQSPANIPGRRAGDCAPDPRGFKTAMHDSRIVEPFPEPARFNGWGRILLLLPKDVVEERKFGAFPGDRFFGRFVET